MPCYDPKPSDRDERAVRVAKLIVYVNTALEMKTNPSIEELAKIGGWDVFGKGKYLDSLTKDLCNIIKSLKVFRPDKFEKIVYDAKSKDSRDLADWWEEHEEFDKKGL